MSSRGLLIATITIAAVTDEVDALEVDLPGFPMAAKVLCHAMAILGIRDVHASVALALDAECADIFFTRLIYVPLGDS
jgi:hypothetical protein